MKKLLASVNFIFFAGLGFYFSFGRFFACKNLRSGAKS